MLAAKNKTTVATNMNSSTNAAQKTSQIASNSGGGKTPLDSLMGQKLLGPKISTVKR